MKHLGDITKINGYDIEPVDVVCGGSPCQNLSLAGNRKGMLSEINGDSENTDSGLFYHAIRILKEMRYADENIRGRTGEFVRPRYYCYENVAGAFSSNGGKDFQAVLTELAMVKDPSCPAVPIPKEGWSYAGCIMGNGFSIAWRTHNAKFWGVAQRRVRVCVVADFGGYTAPEVLSVTESVPRSSSENREKGKGSRADTHKDASKPKQMGSILLDYHPMDDRIRIQQDQDAFPTLNSHMGTGGNNVPLIMEKINE